MATLLKASVEQTFVTFLNYWETNEPPLVCGWLLVRWRMLAA